MAWKIILLTLAVAASSTSCSHGGDSPIRLSRSGACGNVFFWATDDAGEIGVTVSLEAPERPAATRTIRRFDVPDDAVDVMVVEGSKLYSTFCTDLPKGTQTSASPATSGTGEIAMTPSDLTDATCGTATGTLKAAGVTARDGAAFAPILVNSDEVGCVSG